MLQIPVGYRHIHIVVLDYKNCENLATPPKNHNITNYKKIKFAIYYLLFYVKDKAGSFYVLP